MNQRQKTAIENHSTEEWRPVPGFEGLYSVSSLGRVRRDAAPPTGVNAGKSGVIRKPSPGRGGYLLLSLYRDGRAYPKKVHALVLEAFVGPCPDGQQARHFPDPDPTNNRLDNLRWGTPAANGADKVTHGTAARGDRNGARTHPHRRPRGEGHANAKLTAAGVSLARRLAAQGTPKSAIARRLMVSRRAIQRALNLETWRHVDESATANGN